MPVPVTGLQEPASESDSDRRPWMILVAIITVCFIVGIGFLLLAVWLDWQ